MLSITWNKELHGVVITVIAVGALCGSVYLLLGTNLGARLGLMVSLAGLFGWMATLGFVWWAYGNGLKGQEPVWHVSDVIVNDGDLSQLGIGPNLNLTDPIAQADANKLQLQDDGWRLLADDDPKRALAIAGADEILQKEAVLLKASEYKSIAVYDKGGKRYPRLFGSDKLDFLAFWHKQHFAIVEVAVVKPVYTEPGRAPRAPVVDDAVPHKYVKMIRDLGDRRKNSAIIGIGSFVVFAVLCIMLHRRDRLVAANRARG